MDECDASCHMSRSPQALNQGIRAPNGVHLIYPVLDSSADVWYPQVR